MVYRFQYLTILKSRRENVNLSMIATFENLDKILAEITSFAAHGNCQTSELKKKPKDP